jgi:hypothetical protein
MATSKGKIGYEGLLWYEKEVPTEKRVANGLQYANKKHGERTEIILVNPNQVPVNSIENLHIEPSSYVLKDHAMFLWRVAKK